MRRGYTPSRTQGRSSAGRALVSKTRGRRFDPCRPCWASGELAVVDAITRARRASSHCSKGYVHSLTAGMRSRTLLRIIEYMSAAATLMTVGPSSRERLLADVLEVDREPVTDRLATALGPAFAEHLVAALSHDALDRLDAALGPAFLERLAALAKQAA